MSTKAYKNFTDGPLRDKLDIGDMVHNSTMRNIDFSQAIQSNVNSALMTNVVSHAFQELFVLPSAKEDADQLTREQIEEEYPGLELPKSGQTMGRSRARALWIRNSFMQHQDSRTAAYTSQKPIRGITAGFIGWSPVILPELLAAKGISSAMRAYSALRFAQSLKRIRQLKGLQRVKALHKLDKGTVRTFKSVERAKNIEALWQGSLINLAHEAWMFGKESSLGYKYDPTMGLLLGGILPLGFRKLGSMWNNKKGRTFQDGQVFVKADDAEKAKLLTEMDATIKRLEKDQADGKRLKIFYDAETAKATGFKGGSFTEVVPGIKELAGKTEAERAEFYKTHEIKPEVREGMEAKAREIIRDREDIEHLISYVSEKVRNLKKSDVFKQLEHKYPDEFKALYKWVGDVSKEYKINENLLFHSIFKDHYKLNVNTQLIKMPAFMDKLSTIIATLEELGDGTVKAFNKGMTDFLTRGELTRDLRTSLTEGLDSYGTKKYGSFINWNNSDEFLSRNREFNNMVYNTASYDPDGLLNSRQKYIDELARIFDKEDFIIAFVGKENIDLGGLPRDATSGVTKKSKDEVVRQDLDSASQTKTVEEFIDEHMPETYRDFYDAGEGVTKVDKTESVKTDKAEGEALAVREETQKDLSEAYDEATKVSDALKEVETKKTEAKAEVKDETATVEIKTTETKLLEEKEAAVKAFEDAQSRMLQEDSATTPQAVESAKNGILDNLFGYYNQPGERAKLVEAKQMTEYQGKFYMLSGIRIDENLLKLKESGVLKVADDHAKRILFLNAKAGSKNSKPFKGILRAYRNTITEVDNAIKGSENTLVVEKLQKLHDVLESQIDHIHKKWANNEPETVKKTKAWQTRVKNGKYEKEFETEALLIQLLQGASKSAEGKSTKAAGAVLNREDFKNARTKAGRDKIYKKLRAQGYSVPKDIWERDHRKIINVMEDLYIAKQMGKAVKDELYEYQKCLLLGGSVE